MNPVKLYVLGGALIGALVFAQGPSIYDGKWSATFLAKDGGNRDAVLILKGTSGTWQLQHMGGKKWNDPCLGREQTATVKSSSAVELKLSIHSSESIAGCRDSNLTLKPINETTLEGQFGDGRVLKLVRQ